MLEEIWNNLTILPKNIKDNCIWKENKELAAPQISKTRC